MSEELKVEISLADMLEKVDKKLAAIQKDIALITTDVAIMNTQMEEHDAQWKNYIDQTDKKIVDVNNRVDDNEKAGRLSQWVAGSAIAILAGLVAIDKWFFGG